MFEDLGHNRYHYFTTFQGFTSICFLQQEKNYSRKAEGPSQGGEVGLAERKLALTPKHVHDSTCVRSHLASKCLRMVQRRHKFTVEKCTCMRGIQRFKIRSLKAFHLFFAFIYCRYKSNVDKLITCIKLHKGLNYYSFWSETWAIPRFSATAHVVFAGLSKTTVT